MPPVDEPNLVAGAGSPSAATGYAVRQISDSIAKGIEEAMDKIIKKVVETLDRALGAGGGGAGGDINNTQGIQPEGSVPTPMFGNPNGGRRNPDQPRTSFGPLPLLAFGTAAARRVEMGMRPDRQQVEISSQAMALASGRGGRQAATWQTFNEIARSGTITGFDSRLDRQQGAAAITSITGYAPNTRQFNRMARGVSAVSLMNPGVGFGGAAEIMQAQYTGAAAQRQLQVGAPTFVGIGGVNRDPTAVNREAIRWGTGGRTLDPESYAQVTAMNGRLRRNLTRVYGEDAAQVMITQGAHEAAFRQREGREINWANKRDRRIVGVEDIEYRTFQRTQEEMTQAGDTTLQGQSAALKHVQTAAEGAARALEHIARLSGLGGVGGFLTGGAGALAGPMAGAAGLSAVRGGGAGGAATGFLTGVAGSFVGRALFSRLSGGAAAGGVLGRMAGMAGGLGGVAGMAARVANPVGKATAVAGAVKLAKGEGKARNSRGGWRWFLGGEDEKFFGLGLGGEQGGPGNEGSSGAGGSSVNILKSLVEKSGVSHRITSTTGGKHSANSLHYRGQAIDIAGPKPGRDTEELRKINNFLADNYGSALKELIYAGPGAKNIKNGKPHTYSKAIMDGHHDHVHVGADPEALSNATGIQMDSNVGGGGSALGTAANAAWNFAGRLGFASKGSVTGRGPVLPTFASKDKGESQTGGKPVGGAPPSGGATGNVEQWISQALGLLNMDTPQNRSIVATMIQKESGGNPRSQNNWDSNAKRGTPSKGIMQTIEPTFNAHKLPGYDDIWNPVDNIIAAVRYATKRYGSLDNVPGIRAMQQGKGYKGYKKGAWEIESDQMAYIHKGEMVVPEKDAAAIRAASKDPFGSQRKGGGGVNLHFAPGSIVLNGVGPTEARQFWNHVKGEMERENRYASIGEH